MSNERNKSCGCGSGKKFKNCCLIKQWQNAQIEREEIKRLVDEDIALGQSRIKNLTQ
jgi:hypothetical protein